MDGAALRHVGRSRVEVSAIVGWVLHRGDPFKVTFRAHIGSGHLDNIPTQLVKKSAAMHVGLPLIRMELAIIFNGTPSNATLRYSVLYIP